MRHRIRLYLQQTDWTERLRLLALLVFPLWVAHFPLMHFVLPASALGLVLPLALAGPLRQWPRLQAALPLVLLLSCLVVVVLMQSSHRSTTIQLACRWLWFCLAFAAANEFWTLSDPVAEEQRQLAGQLRKLNQQLEDTLQQLKRQT